MRSLLEGLGDLGGPCAKVLSVAGLLALIGRFPGRIRLFPEVRKASLLRAGPSLFDNPDRTVNTDER